MTHSADRIDILLPAWNGERFFQAQLNSLLAQQKVNSRIIVRDDASDDGTFCLARTYAARHANIEVHAGPRLGVVGNINWLLARSATEDKASYFALSDQDDVWHPHKLSREMDTMHTLEYRFGSDTPLLVCSDARCVDDQNCELHPSFLKQLGVPSDWGKDLRQTLVMSHALGCSCLGNTALRRLALPIPAAEDIFMHDWWLLLVAMCFGAVDCIHEPLLDYRQHVGNVLGAKGKGRFLQRLAASRRYAWRSQRQARTFLTRFADKLDNWQRDAVYTWAFMPISPLWYRHWLCWRHGFAKPGLMRLLI